MNQHPDWKKRLSKVAWLRQLYYGAHCLGGMLSQPWRKGRIEAYCGQGGVRKLNLGCGRNVLPGWLNTDLQCRKGILFVNASKKLPFENEIFDYVFTEHMIEHLAYLSGKKMLQECARVLKKGGRIRVATPDLEFLIRFYQDKTSPFKKTYADWAASEFYPHYQKNGDSFLVNNFFYSWGHQFIYDFETLKDLLQDAGFTDVERCAVGESNDPQLNKIEHHGQVIGEERNRYETMVVEAVKK